jgi:hypothetical protein
MRMGWGSKRYIQTRNTSIPRKITGLFAFERNLKRE